MPTKIVLEFAQIVKFGASEKEGKIQCKLKVGTLMTEELAVKLEVYPLFYKEDGPISNATKTTLRKSFANWFARITAPRSEQSLEAEVKCSSIENFIVEEKEPGFLSMTVDLHFVGKASHWVEFWESTIGTPLTVEMTDSQLEMFAVPPTTKRKGHDKHVQ